MSQRTFLIQPLNYTVKSYANTYEDISIEILGHQINWYYLSDSPIGYPNNGRIKDRVHTLYLRQKCSLQSVIEEMVTNDPLIIEIDPKGRGISTMYNSVPPGFKIVLQELIFNHEPRERTFRLNGSDPIRFDNVKNKGFLDYELFPVGQRIELSFTGIKGLVQVKIYFIPINIGALIHTFIPSIPKEFFRSKYPSKKIECMINRKTVQVSSELPDNSEIKYLSFEGIHGNIINKEDWNGNWETLGNKWIFYPWSRIISKEINYQIKTDKQQNKVILIVYFKPEKKELGNQLPEALTWKTISLKYYRDDSYRIIIKDIHRITAFKLTDPNYPNIFILYEEETVPKLIRLQVKDGICQVDFQSNFIILIVSKSKIPETYSRSSNLNKRLNVNICTLDNYQEEKGSEINFSELQEYIFSP